MWLFLKCLRRLSLAFQDELVVLHADFQVLLRNTWKNGAQIASVESPQAVSITGLNVHWLPCRA